MKEIIKNIAYLLSWIASFLAMTGEGERACGVRKEA
jgi:hypothetical protein